MGLSLEELQDQIKAGVTANGGNADTVGTLHASQFMRADADTGTSGNLVIGKNLTINKQNNTSQIIFPAQTNDAGYIQHYENNNLSSMRFSVSNDNDGGDKFLFGSTTNGTFSTCLSIDTIGNVVANGDIYSRNKKCATIDQIPVTFPASSITGLAFLALNTNCFVQDADPGTSAAIGAIWFDTTNYVIKHKKSDGWHIFGASYL